MTHLDPELLGDFIRKGAAEVGATFTRPDADWSPIAFIVAPSELVPVPLDEGMGNADDRDVVAMALAAQALMVGATHVGLVLSTWQVLAQEREPDGPPPSEHPDRFEALLVDVISADEERLWIAKIERHDTLPPALSEWDGPSEAGESRFGRYIQPALRAVRDESASNN